MVTLNGRNEWLNYFCDVFRPVRLTKPLTQGAAGSGWILSRGPGVFSDWDFRTPTAVGHVERTGCRSSDFAEVQTAVQTAQWIFQSIVLEVHKQAGLAGIHTWASSSLRWGEEEGQKRNGMDKINYP